MNICLARLPTKVKRKSGGVFTCKLCSVSVGYLLALSTLSITNIVVYQLRTVDILEKITNNKTSFIYILENANNICF